MYSLVLVAAVAGSPDVSGADTPAAVAAHDSFGCSGVVSSYGCGASCFGRSYGCGMSVAMPAYKAGCYGSCMGTVASYGCTGSCYGSSCYGSSCHGATAEAPAKHGFLGILDCIRARRAAKSSAGAGCTGTVSYGCTGSGCYGASCHGTVVSYGCSGGCYGSTAVWGAAVSTPATTVIGEKVISEKVVPAPMPGTTTTDPKKGATTDPKKPEGNEEGANIKFTLPANAKLFVDGRPTSGEGTERAFFTPPLVAGQKFFYDVKAELVVDGKTVTEEKRVIVRAGDDLRESFPKLFVAAGNPASVASK